jgi:hypothetical protein
LQFTPPSVRTANAPFGDGNMAQADIIRPTALPPMAGEAGIRVLGQDKL